MSLPLDDLRPTEAAERRLAIVLRIVRTAFVVLMFTFALLAALQQQQSEKRLFVTDTRGWMPVIAAVGVAVILILTAIAFDLIYEWRNGWAVQAVSLMPMPIVPPKR